MKVIDRSIRGDYRDLNEDVTGIFKNGTGQMLMLVSDGMGGHRYGDVASRFVHDEVGDAWENENLLNVEDGVEFLRRLVMDVNRRMFDYQQENPEYQGMGTTLVLAAVIEETIIILNVGDSRAYAMNDRTIEQVTKDHSFVNHAGRCRGNHRSGGQSPPEAQYHYKGDGYRPSDPGRCLQTEEQAV